MTGKGMIEAFRGDKQRGIEAFRRVINKR